MFTGFASENTPAIQVWDYFQAYAGAFVPRNVSLADDCAPIQYFRTGGDAFTMRLYLPSAPIEGKQIKIINSKYGNNTQPINIFSSDRSGNGTSTAIANLGPGCSLDFCYSKNFISFGSSSGLSATGWITLNQVPTGAANYHSLVIGGNENSASSNYSTVVGGFSNSATSSYCGVFGAQSSNATQSYAQVLGGFQCNSSGSNSVVLNGTSNTSSGSASTVINGNNNLANSTNGIVISGSYGTTRSIAGNTVTPASESPIASTAGVTQSALLVLGVETTNSTATVLRSNTSAASTTNQVILPNNSAYVFQGTCIANVTGGSTTSGWKFEGVIKRGANAASTALVAAVTPTVIAQDVAAATWVLAITANTTNGGIKVEVTGAAATTIRWVSRIETTEVTF